MASGERPSGEVLIGYQYDYLSAALNPRSGEMLALILPGMRIESFRHSSVSFVNLSVSKHPFG